MLLLEFYEWHAGNGAIKSLGASVGGQANSDLNFFFFIQVCYRRGGSMDLH